jgi:hypothetical protein
MHGSRKVSFAHDLPDQVGTFPVAAAGPLGVLCLQEEDIGLAELPPAASYLP